MGLSYRLFYCSVISKVKRFCKHAEDITYLEALSLKEKIPGQGFRPRSKVSGAGADDKNITLSIL